MKLNKKKELAAKTLKVGKHRLVFSKEALSEIKEAITKQDIKDLHNQKIISIKPVKGRKKIKKRKTKRGPGKIKKKINRRKEIYVKLTRKLRAYISELKKRNVLSNELYWDLRKKIRMRLFKSKANLREYLNTLEEFSFHPEETKKPKEAKKPREKSKNAGGKK